MGSPWGVRVTYETREILTENPGVVLQGFKALVELALERKREQVRLLEYELADLERQEALLEAGEL